MQLPWHQNSLSTQHESSTKNSTESQKVVSEAEAESRIAVLAAWMQQTLTKTAT